MANNTFSLGTDFKATDKFFLTDVMYAIHKVGRTVLMPAYTSIDPVDSKMKGNKTIVTQADSDAETAIVRALKRIDPDADGIISEEIEEGRSEAEPDYDWTKSPLLQTKGRVWIVDPMDGSAHFADKDPTHPFGIMIGLRDHQKTVMNVIYFPVTQEFLFACEGIDGAWTTTVEDGALTPPERKKAQPLTSEMFLAHRRKGDNQAKPDDVIGEAAKMFGERNYQVKSIAATLHRMLLGGGNIVYAFEGIEPKGLAIWDFCTEFLARKAGLAVTTLDGKPISHTQGQTNIVIAPDRSVTDDIRSSYERMLAASQKART